MIIDKQEEPKQEETKTDDAKLNKEDYLQAELKKVIEQRQELKKKLEDLEKSKNEAEAKRLEEEGKFKELYSAAADKLKEFETYKTKAEEFERKYSELETQRREELLSKIPETKKEFAKKLNTSELIEFSKIEGVDTPNLDGRRPGGKIRTNITKADLPNLTSEELEQVAKTQPDLLQEILKLNKFRKF